MSVRIQKIYTKTGDKGQTALIKGVRVDKDSLQVETYGTSDELNSFLGLIRTVAIDYRTTHPEIADEIEKTFRKIQNDIFDIGSLLATPEKHLPEFPEAYDSDEDPRIQFLESKIDTYKDGFAVLKSFTLPGGGLLNAHAHVARTVCRRWERLIVRFSKEHPVHPAIIVYANRLSDFLYAFSRWVAKELDEDEFLWEPNEV
ncbi:cob(I)yrinic acid a,c-diamide adenosyltransferase [bacterium AH-315-E10]|nr:cob(I)yrinic acid a,c-diamide adenosyltransferase [bacterium AH-315-E10]